MLQESQVHAWLGFEDLCRFYGGPLKEVSVRPIERLCKLVYCLTSLLATVPGETCADDG